MLKGNDLIVTNKDGTSYGYIIAEGVDNPVVHLTESPNVPLSSSSTPAQTSGQYDVREAQGDKAITHLDWSLGAGQKTLDYVDSVPSRFYESSCIDIKTKGQMSLQREMTLNPIGYYTGKLFSIGGYYFMSSDTGTYLYISADHGSTWTVSVPSSGAPRDFMTDGYRAYFCASDGIYVGNKALTTTPRSSTGWTWTKIYASETANIMHICYSNGTIWGATANAVGTCDLVTGQWTKKTADWQNVMTSIGLESIATDVYWTVSSAGKTLVYHFVQDSSLNIVWEQYAEFPKGFIATCTMEYMNVLYVGGYFESSYSGVGMGTIYRVEGTGAVKLMDIGDVPEETASPTATENDNRIWAMTPGDKDIYFLTYRGIYRWDIDDGGYSHMSSLPTSTETITFSGLVYDMGYVASMYTYPSRPASRAISSSTAANPTLVTCVLHGYTNGQTVEIIGHSNAAVNGLHVITYVSTSQFRIAVLGGGTGGYISREGMAQLSTAKSSSGYLTQSSTSLHTGSILKDFRSVVVSHDALPTGSTLACTVWIDEVAHVLTGTTVGTLTTFPIDLTGKSIRSKLTLTRGTDTTKSPVVRSVNVIFNFEKLRKHQYTLDCRAGANSGRWQEDPDLAMMHLMDSSNRECTFEDRFAGTFLGTIEQVEVYGAIHTPREGYSGLVRLSIRES